MATLAEVMLGDREVRESYGLTITELYSCIECADGLIFSAQGGRTHYCKPRSSYGHYFQLEVGYPKDKDGNPVRMPDTWNKYAVGDPDTCNIWGCVPVELIQALIDAHGGEKEEDATQ